MGGATKTRPRVTGRALPTWYLVLWGIGSVIVLVGLAVLALEPKFQAARVLKTTLDIQTLDDCLQLYVRRTGHFPDAADGVRSLVETCELSAAFLRDGWDRPYHYALIEGRPVITSYGRDGVPHGEGPDADISSLSPARPDLLRSQVHR